MAVIFALWSATAKLAQISYFFTISKKIVTIDLSNLSILFHPFLIRLKTSIFLLKRNTLWLLFGESEFPESLLLCFEAVN